MRRINVLVIDHQLFRAGLRIFFAGTAYHILGEASTLDEAYRWLSHMPADSPRPDILLVDPEAGQAGDELDWPCRFRTLLPGVKTIILANCAPNGSVARSLSAEIDGYLLKDVSAEVLIQSLDLIVLGQQILPGRVEPPPVRAPAAPPPPAPPRNTGVVDLGRPERLSPREIQILRLLVSGHSNKRIARDLSISDATVKVHMKGLLRKMHASNRTQAAIWAVSHGIGVAANGTATDEHHPSQLAV
jgi:two-component system nitrate/nitrite response regulator NarL